MSAVSAIDLSIEVRRCLRLYALAEDSGGSFPRDQCLTDVQSLIGGSYSSAEKALQVLEISGVANVAEGLIRLASIEGLTRENLVKYVADKLARKFLSEFEHEKVASAFQVRSESKELWVDSKRLPGHSDLWPATLISWGIFEREEVRSRLWQLSPEYHAYFFAVLKLARGTGRRKISLSELSTRLKRQDEMGREAEEWVVGFERRRLKGHLLLDSVRRVSDEDVGAGYDILSFSSLHVLGHDRFIEVKCFGGDKGFYWSDNEIEAAKDLGERYVLYLVDRKRMTDADYAPQVISGPYGYFFGGDTPGWSMSVSSYYFSEILR